MRRILRVALLGMMGVPSILVSQTILVHAHRGGRAARPENTLASFTMESSKERTCSNLTWR